MAGIARQLSIHDISGTEWPLFGAVYYLRATENLDRAWLRSRSGARPADYARVAINAAADLLADPVQADWVQRHWGTDDYLHRENVFYRMLVIDGLATQARLLGGTPHESLLRTQVLSLAAELSASPSGLLADYPQQTFPADVAAAWHAIRRADEHLGTDHHAGAIRGLRGFTGTLSPHGGLPPYAWFGDDPPRPTQVRGSANAWLLHHAPFLWPTQAERWFTAHNRDFWQASWWLVGYREFDRNERVTDPGDVDSGPIIGGLGTAASAFGIGATRSMGDGTRARALSLQAIAMSWPLPNGRLLLPRVLSDLAHAPMLGEAALLYNLTQPPAPDISHRGTAGSAELKVPGMAWAVLSFQIMLAACALVGGARLLQRQWRKRGLR